MGVTGFDILILIIILFVIIRVVLVPLGIITALVMLIRRLRKGDR